jgi:hypothetical protein
MLGNTPAWLLGNPSIAGWVDTSKYGKGESLRGGTGCGDVYIEPRISQSSVAGQILPHRRSMLQLVKTQMIVDSRGFRNFFFDNFAAHA